MRTRFFWGYMTFGCLIALVSLFLFYQIFLIQPQDLSEYKELMNRNSENLDAYKVEQTREGVIKTLLFSEGNERKLGVLQSRTSEMVYGKEGAKSQLIENLKDVRLIYQESFLKDKNQQIIMTMEAETARYYYDSEQLIAQDVLIKRYLISGYSFPEKKIEGMPFFNGTASKLILELKNETPKLEVFQLKAIFEK